MEGYYPQQVEVNKRDRTEIYEWSKREIPKRGGYCAPFGVLLTRHVARTWFPMHRVPVTTRGNEAMVVIQRLEDLICDLCHPKLFSHAPLLRTKYRMLSWKLIQFSKLQEYGVETHSLDCSSVQITQSTKPLFWPTEAHQPRLLSNHNTQIWTSNMHYWSRYTMCMGSNRVRAEC